MIVKEPILQLVITLVQSRADPITRCWRNMFVLEFDTQVIRFMEPDIRVEATIPTKEISLAGK